MATILVLDDEPDAVALIRVVLRRKGHEVFGFTEEEEAVAFARSQTVDLAILDLKLKKMSGVEVLEEIKRIDARILVMMLTGYSTEESVREANELGADAYCLKPIELDELEEKVNALLARLRSD